MPATSCLGVPVPLTQKPEIKGRRRETSHVWRRLSSRKAFGLRQHPCRRQDLLFGIRAPRRTSRSRRGKCTNSASWTEELRFGYACDADSARDESDQNVWRGEWNPSHHSRHVQSEANSGPSGGASDGYGLG